MKAWVPDVDILDVLPMSLWPRADCARWFLGSIIRKSMFGNADDEGYVRLSAEICRSVMGQRTWRGVRNSLIRSGVVKTRNHVAGLRCRGYRLGDRIGGQPRRVPLVEPGLLSRLSAFQDGRQQERELTWLPVHRELRAAQQGLRVKPEVDGALADLEGPSRCIQSALVQNIRDCRPSFSVGSTRRVYNGITGMKKTLREHVRLGGEPIKGVDIRAAQPALLGLLMTSDGLRNPLRRGKGRTNIDSAVSAGCVSSHAAFVLCFSATLAGCVEIDAVEFASCCREGKLWTELLAACRANGLRVPADRVVALRWVKKRFLVDVVACDGRYRSGFRAVVLAMWPSVCAFCLAANVASGGGLIAALQRLESWLVVESVAPRLVRDAPIVTVHDAIYSRESDRKRVRDAFYETFEDYGFELQLKDEG